MIQSIILKFLLNLILGVWSCHISNLMRAQRTYKRLESLYLRFLTIRKPKLLLFVVWLTLITFMYVV